MSGRAVIEQTLLEMPRYGMDPGWSGKIDHKLTPSKTFKINVGCWIEYHNAEKYVRKFRFLFPAHEQGNANSSIAAFANLKEPGDELVRVLVNDYEFFVLANEQEKVELGRMAVANSMEESKRIRLNEEMSFRQLMNYSTPERVVRSLTVHGPPLNIRAFEDSMYYLFNFKSNPSTTGLRHKGYIKFLKPRHRKALMDVHCVVDCTCPDFRYRWAWADKQRRASKVGSDSMNQALNRAPHITNPTARPGLCKHLLALRNWIDNSLDVMTSEHPDDGSALSRLVAYAQHRHANEPEIMAAAKSRNYDQVLAMLRKRRGEPGPLDKAAGKTPKGEPEEGPEPPKKEGPQAGPPTEPPLVSPPDSPNPLDFHGRLKPPLLTQEPDDEDEESRTESSVDSIETNTTMNLIEAQQVVKEMIDASPAAQPSLGTTSGTNVATGTAATPGTNPEGDVSAESEALNLLRNINAGIQELVPAIQAMSQGGGLQGPGDMDGIDFPEPGGEGEGGEGDLGGGDFPSELDTADRLDTGGEDKGGEFGDLGGGDFGSASREASAGREASASREASGGREFGGKKGSSSRERESKRSKLSVSGKED